jgi:hypothetical protein
MRGVRYTEIGWEGQCDKCRQWWPLDTESWRPRTGMRRCYACLKEERRTYLATLRADNPDMRERHRVTNRANQQAKRAADPQSWLEYQRRWYAEHHVRINAERAELHAIRSELAGHRIQRTSRDETPETLAIRAAFRKKWMAENRAVPPTEIERLERRRERKREWMRRKRAA